jgi:hypothetical protein
LHIARGRILRPTTEVVLRQVVQDEYAKANLPGTHKPFTKAKKWPALAVIFQQLSARGELRHVRGKLLELSNWVGEGVVQTFAREQFVRDYDVLRDTPPSSCRVTVPDLLRMRRRGLLNDSIVTAALETICHRASGATSYPVLSANVALDVCKQLTKAIDAGHERVILALNHSVRWIGVFVHARTSKYFVYNSLGSDHIGTVCVHHTIISVAQKPLDFGQM